MKFCTNCRKQINRDAKFCEGCGTKQKEQNYATPNVTTQTPPPYYVQSNETSDNIANVDASIVDNNLPNLPNEEIKPSANEIETQTITSITEFETEEIPQENHSQENYSHEEISQENHSYDENHSQENHSHEELPQENHLQENYSHEEIPQENHSHDNYQQANYQHEDLPPADIVTNSNKKQITTQIIIVAIIGVLVALIVSFVLDFQDDFVEEVDKGDLFVNLDVEDLPTVTPDIDLDIESTAMFEMVGTKLVEFTQNQAIVILPDTITSIEANAFSNCTELVLIKLPSSIENIDPDAFNGCTNLFEFDFIAEPSDDIYDMLAKLTIYKDFIINDRTISSYRGLSTSITIPNFITKIDDGYLDYDSNIGVFSNRYNIKTLVIPDSVTYIGSSAFANCTSLETITLSQNIEYIGENAFEGCESLVELILPENLKYIGENAFTNCSSLLNIEIPSNVLIIESELFSNCVSLESVTLNDTITIKENAFMNCIALTEIEIPSTVTEVGYGAFLNVPFFSELSNEFNIVGDGVLIKYIGDGIDIQIPDSVKHISNVFFACNDLQTVLLPDTLITINKNAFANRTKLIQIEIPNSVTDIGEGAFSNCTSLESISIPDSVEIIGENAFYNCENLENILVSDNVQIVGNSAFEGTIWLNNLEEEYNIIGENNLIKYNYVSNKTEVPVGVTAIIDRLFFNATQLKNITLPVTLTSIGNESFFGCTNLEEIEIPNTLTSIGYNAFNGCDGLTQIKLPSSIEYIGEYAFEGCKNLEIVYVRENSYAQEWTWNNLSSNIKIEVY